MNINLFLLFMLIALVSANQQRKPVKCENDKGFLCYDHTHFYQCVQIGNENLIIAKQQECPPGLYCDDRMDFECVEEWELPPSSSSTTQTPITTTSSSSEATTTLTTKSTAVTEPPTTTRPATITTSTVMTTSAESNKTQGTTPVTTAITQSSVANETSSTREYTSTTHFTAHTTIEGDGTAKTIESSVVSNAPIISTTNLPNTTYEITTKTPLTTSITTPGHSSNSTYTPSITESQETIFIPPITTPSTPTQTTTIYFTSEQTTVIAPSISTEQSSEQTTSSSRGTTTTTEGTTTTKASSSTTTTATPTTHRSTESETPESTTEAATTTTTRPTHVTTTRTTEGGGGHTSTERTTTTEAPVVTNTTSESTTESEPATTSSAEQTTSSSRGTTTTTEGTTTTKASSATTTTAESNVTSSSTSAASTTTWPPGITQSPYPPFKCPGVGIYPDTVNCSLYHACMNAHTFLLDVPIGCPEGTQFDSERSKCTRDPVQCPGDPPLHCEAPGTYPHPTDCSRYYKCTWRGLFLKYELKQYRCPPHYKFDYKQKKCSKSVTAECYGNSTLPSGNSTSPPFTCVEEGCFPTDYNCEDYYMCRNKNGTLEIKLKHCGCGKLFDRERRRCVKAFMAHCPIDGEDENDSAESDWGSDFSE